MTTSISARSAVAANELVSAKYEPHVPRNYGRLKNGNPSGDFSKAPRCGAKTRSGGLCQSPAMRRSGRCRLHGGASTGPLTLIGKGKSSMNNLKDGLYRAERLEQRLKLRRYERVAREHQKALMDFFDTVRLLHEVRGVRVQLEDSLG